MATRKRRNPAPLTGALFVANPRKRTVCRDDNPRGRIGAPRDSRGRFLKKGAKGIWRGDNPTPRRRRVSLFDNPRDARGRFLPLSRRTIGRDDNPPSRKRGKRGSSFKFSFLPGRRIMLRDNPPQKNTALARSATAFGIVAKPLKKIPVIGKTLAKYAPPVLTGATAIIPVHFGLKYGGQYLPGFLKPIGYTLGGILVALLAGIVPLLKPKTKLALGVAATTAGGAIDILRFIKGTSSELGQVDDLSDADAYGNGVAEEIVPLGQDMGALAISQDYADASLADAYYSGSDLDTMEGEAALGGPLAWRRVFGPPPIRAAKPVSPVSHLAGKPGHRWGWLIRLIGFQNFAWLAAQSPEKRLAIVHQLRQAALAQFAQLRGGVERPVPAQPEQAAGDLGGLMFAGAAF